LIFGFVLTPENAFITGLGSKSVFIAKTMLRNITNKSKKVKET